MGIGHLGISILNSNKNASRRNARYANLKAQYKDSAISTDDELLLKQLTPEQIQAGRERAKAYLRRRNRINWTITVVIIIAIATPILFYVYQLLS